MKNKAVSLRQRAKEFLNKYPEIVKETASVDVKKLVEDLHIYQIELEIQNEELRRAQLELKASRDRYSDLYDFAPVGYVTISEQGLILQANLSCAGMFGMERTSFMGRAFSRFIKKDDQEVFYHHRKKLIETKAKQVCELILVRKDRSRFHARLESIIVKDTNGGIGQIRTMIIDITDHKLAEKELLTLNQRLELAQNVAKAGTWDWDIDSGNIIWSNQMFALFGLDPLKTAASFEAWRSVLHPDDLEIAKQRIDLALKERFMLGSDYRIILPSGEIRWINSVGKGEYDEQNRPIRMIGICLDITERKQMEAALLKSKWYLNEELKVAKQLQKISTKLIGEENVDTLYDHILEAAVTLMRSDMASIQLLHKDQAGANMLMLLGHRGFNPEFAEAYKFVHADTECVCGQALHLISQVIVEDIETCEFMLGPSDLENYRKAGIRAVQSTPLISLSGMLLGIISNHWRQPHRPSERDLRFLDVLARQAADLIERKKAYKELDLRVQERTAELRESEKRFRLMVEASSELLYRMSPDWREMRQLHSRGFIANTVERDRNWLQEYIPPEDQPHMIAAINEAIRTRSVFELEHRVLRADGSLGWAFSRAVPLMNENGEIIEWFGAAIDITERVAAGQSLKESLAEINALKNRLEAEKAYLQEEIKSEFNYKNIIGNSEALRYVLYKVEQIAPTDTAVIILGETGTGKELIARAIHDAGLRRNRSLVKVDCATLPSNLMESELFGHEKGAFSGAIVQRLGRFEIADGATLFLDEIGELSLELQAKLLRVLQDGEFERVGSSQTTKVDVRIIAATNRDLAAEVRNGRFRQDLWFRLNIFPITMPPLRNRKEDIPMLVEFFVEKISNRLGKSIDYIPKSVMDTLQNYHWPGNIRELQNVIERAVINVSENKLRLMDKLDTPRKVLPKALKTMEKVEHDHIVQILEETRWKVGGKNGAAQILGLNPSTLRGRMRKLGIRKPKPGYF